MLDCGGFTPPFVNRHNVVAPGVPIPGVRVTSISYSPETGYLYAQGRGGAGRARRVSEDPWFRRRAVRRAVDGTWVLGLHARWHAPGAAGAPDRCWPALRRRPRETDEIMTSTLVQSAERGVGLRYAVDEHAFNPSQARVKAGTVITFVNSGMMTHTVTATDKSWSTVS